MGVIHVKHSLKSPRSCIQWQWRLFAQGVLIVLVNRFFRIMSNMNANSKKQTRPHNIKRTFVLLRNDDELLVPRTSTLKNLCDSGRLRDIEFSNNATSHHISEILSNSFSNILSREEFGK